MGLLWLLLLVVNLFLVKFGEKMYWKLLADQGIEQLNKIKSQHKKNYARVYLGPEFPGIYLTAREEECAICIMQGNTLKEVAKTLDLSPRTVEFYLKNIKNKLNCRTKFQMMRALIVTSWYRDFQNDLEETTF